MLKSKKYWTIAGTLASALAAATLTMPARADGAYSVKMDIVETDMDTSQSTTSHWSHDLTGDHDAPMPIRIEAETGTAYEININLAEQDDETVLAELKICKEEGTECSPLAEPSLSFTKDTHAEIVIGNVLEDPEQETTKLFDGLSIKIAHSVS